MLFDWKSVFLFVGAGQGLIVGLILLFAKTESYKRIFGLITLMFAIHLIEYSVFRSLNGFDKLVDFFGYRFPMRLCIGPLFLIYTLRLTQNKKWHPFVVGFHLFPALASVLLLIPFFSLSHTAKSLLLNNFVPFGNHYYYKLISLLWISSILSMFTYIFFSLIKLKNYRERSIEYYSNEMKIWVSSFYRFTFLCVLILSGYLLAVVLRLFNVLDTSLLYSVMSFILMTNLIVLSITVMKQKRIIPIENTILKNRFDARAKNRVTQEELNELDTLVLNNKLFLRPDLTISDLASELKIPPYILSYRINRGHGKSFFTYINEYRVEYSKNLLSQTDLKILAVAFDSGFANKTSYHRTFKRIEGITPEVFRCKSRTLE